MSTVTTTLAMILRRMRANWRLLSVVGLGVLVAAVLLSATTIYTRSLADLGLTDALRDRVGDSGPVLATLDGVPLGGEGSAAVRGFVEESLDERLGAFASGRVRSARTGPFFVDLPRLRDAPIPTSATFTAISDYESQVTVEGRLPHAPAVIRDADAGFDRLSGPIEVALPRALAEAAGLGIGDRVPLVDQFDECDREPPPPPGAPPTVPPCTPRVSVQVGLSVTVVGLIDKIDPDDVFWQVNPVSFSRPELRFQFGRVMPIFVDEETMFGPLAEVLPGYPAEMRWLELLDVEAFEVSRLDETQALFDALREDLVGVGGFVFSPVERTLDTFETELNFSEVPILLLLVQVIGVVLFYLIIVSTLLVERQAAEIALLRSRGSSLRQLLSWYAGESLLIAVAATAVAPFIAGAVIGALGFTGTFSEVTGGRWIDTELTPLSWGLAAAGAAFALVAILLPVAVLARIRGVEQRQRAARPATRNVVQRYYLDVAFVIIAAGLIWEADQRGSVFERDSVGGLSSEPLLLITPALFALAFVAVLVRLLPYVLRALAWVLRDHVAVPVTAALQQTVRNPGPSMRLTMLLMLGAALGTFAASYGGTVDRSFDERTRYEAGVDLRANLEEFGKRPPGAVVEAVAAVPGAGSVAAVLRRPATTVRATSRSGGFDLLAVDPAKTADLLWFRDDFAASSLDDLMRRIGAPDAGRGIRLPNDPERLQLWANPSIELERMSIWMRLRDGRDRFFSLRLGTLERAGEWQQLSVDAGEVIRQQRYEPPFSFHGIFMSEGVGTSRPEPGFVLYDDFSVTDSAGVETVLEDFEGTRLGWELIRVRPDRVDEIQALQTEEAHGGEGVLKFTLALGASTGRRGFFVSDPVLCPGGTECRVPVIASSSFLSARGLSVGSRTSIRVTDVTVPAFIVDSVELFPTLDPAGAGFLIANLDHLYYLGGVMDFDPVFVPNEVWLSGPSEPRLRDGLVETLEARPFLFKRFVDGPRLLAEVGSDPLTAAGGSGILLLSFIAVGALIALAFLVTVYLSAQQRTVEVAVLRTLGVSRRQLLSQLTLEYALIVAVGLVAGTILGTQIARLMLSFLEVTELGDRVLPPFLVDTDWLIVAISYAALLGVFSAGVLAAWRFFIRLPIQRVLRLTE